MSTCSSEATVLLMSPRGVDGGASSAYTDERPVRKKGWTAVRPSPWRRRASSGGSEPSNRSDSRIYTGFRRRTWDGGRSVLVDRLVLVFAWTLLILTLPFSLLFCIRVVSEFKRVVIFRMGRLIGSKGPGLVIILPLVDDKKTVDLRVQSFEVPMQEMLTCDSIVIAVNAVVYYRLSDPIAALNAIKDPHKITMNLTQTTLRKVVGSRKFTDIISDRRNISTTAELLLDNATRHWGVRVERLVIGDVMLPRSLHRVMAKEAEAVRYSEANVLKAYGEQKASVFLVEAADVLSSSTGAIQLRFMQCLSKICTSRTHTVVVPAPSELPEESKQWLKDKLQSIFGRSDDAID